MEAKEGKDLLILFGQWMFIKSKTYIQKHQPTLYYLDGGPKRSFVFEELQPIQDR